MTKKVQVLFEFESPGPKPMLYRGVKAADHGYRMEKKGREAKHFKPYMWTGGEQGLVSQFYINSRPSPNYWKWKPTGPTPAWIVERMHMRPDWADSQT